MNTMSSSESLNQGASRETSKSDQKQRAKNTPGLIPLAIHRGLELDLDSEDFPELPSSSNGTKTSLKDTSTNLNIAAPDDANKRFFDNLAVNNRKVSRRKGTPTLARRALELAPKITPSNGSTKERESASNINSPVGAAAPGWTKSGAAVLQTPYNRAVNVAAQTG